MQLDRCLANAGCRNLFRYSQVIHLAPLTFDDIPILLQVEQGPNQRKHKQFRFEDEWLQREDCAQAIAGDWSKRVFGTPSFCACENIKGARIKLLKWKQSLASVKEEIKITRD
ncbi:hypothetical protein PS1_038355 [Malus domestica]